jgi:hypothetical protein
MLGIEEGWLEVFKDNSFAKDMRYVHSLYAQILYHVATESGPLSTPLRTYYDMASNILNWVAGAEEIEVVRFNY